MQARTRVVYRRLGVTALAAMAIARPADAAAQDPPVTVRQEVIVTASLSPVAFDALTRSATTVTREDLERAGVAGIVEALRLLPGVDVRARGPRGVQTDILVRGATFGQSLVLVDGFRVNDSQSGHHNGELPMAIGGLDRIELLSGAGSAVHGADALGGTINVITRTDRHLTGSITFGQHGYAAGEGSVAGRGLPEGWTLTGWAARSSGFDVDRDFRLGGGAVRGRVGHGWSLDARHQRRAFGANGFYGPSPSFEWTDQTFLAGRWSGDGAGWSTAVRAQYRNHGDHFRWDINRPGFAENRHRTDAVEVVGETRRALGGRGRLTAGASGGGDWIDSSNLGDRRYGRGSVFAEADWRAGARASFQAGLRLDAYSTFGHAWSPSVSGGVWLHPEVRLRASVARGFRIPTYTELYYTDPGHLARADLTPERGWSLDAGVDWARDGWLVTVAPYRRWDADVIDWVKAAPADRWRTTNVRDVTTTGLELALRRAWRDVLVRGALTLQDVDAPALDLLSKYVLDYSSRSAVLTVAGPVVARIRGAVTLDHRRRHDGQSYTLAGIRVSRPAGVAEIFVDVTNAFDEDYTEIGGVTMPGRWVTVGLSVRR
jgi:iron complex outermembrane receptor protein